MSDWPDYSEALADKDQPNGYPGLDSAGHLKAPAIPDWLLRSTAAAGGQVPVADGVGGYTWETTPVGLPVVTDVAAIPHGLDSTGVSDRNGLLYDAASGKWKASSSIVTDDRGAAAEDLLKHDGTQFVRFPKGATGEQAAVRDDGTIGWVAPPEIMAEAWGIKPTNADTVNQTKLANAAAAAQAVGGNIRFRQGRYDIAGVANSYGMLVGISLDGSHSVTLSGPGSGADSAPHGTILNYTGDSGSLISGRSSAGLTLDGVACTYSNTAYQGNLIDLDWLTQNTISTTGLPTSGTWTLTFTYGLQTYTTGAIAWNATGGAIAAAMNAVLPAPPPGAPASARISASSTSLPAQVKLASTWGTPLVLTGHTDSLAGGTSPAVVLNAGIGGGDVAYFNARNCYFGSTNVLVPTTVGVVNYPTATLQLTSVAGLANAGTVCAVGGGFVTYNGIVGNTLQNCVWNGSGTVAAGARVYGGAIMGRTAISLNKTIDSNIGPNCVFNYFRYGIVGMGSSYAIEIEVDTCRFSKMGICSILNPGEDWDIHGGATEPTMAGQAAFIWRNTSSFGYALSVKNHWMGDVADANASWIKFADVGVIASDFNNNRVYTGADAFVVLTAASKPYSLKFSGGRYEVTSLVRANQNSIILTGATGGTWTLTFSWNGGIYTTAAIAYNATPQAVADAMNTAIGGGYWAPIYSAGGGPLPSTLIRLACVGTINLSLISVDATGLTGSPPASPLNTDTTSGTIYSGSINSGDYPLIPFVGVNLVNYDIGGAGSASAPIKWNHTRWLGNVPLFQTPTFSPLVDLSTITTDISLGNHFTVTLGGSRTMGNPTVGSDSMIYTTGLPTSGTWTLTFVYLGNSYTTAAIAYNASGATIAAAMNTAIGAGSAISGSAGSLPGSVTVAATRGATFSLTSANSAGLTGGAVVVATAGGLLNSFGATPRDGQLIVYRIKQDATGGRTITWGSQFRFSNSIPTPNLSATANLTDYVGFKYNAADAKWDCVGFIAGN